MIEKKRYRSYREVMRVADSAALMGLDIGNTSIKAIAFDLRGHQIAAASRPTHHARTVTLDVPGYRFTHLLDANLVWHAVQEVLTQVASRLKDQWAVQGLAITGMGGPTVALDADGRPVYPILTGWPLDVVQSPLAQNVKDADLYQKTGYHLHNSLFANVSWLSAHDAQRFGRIRSLMSVESFVAYRLTGVQAADPSTAGASGAWDHDQRRWAVDIATAAGVPMEIFPPIAESGTLLGRLRPLVAQATGLPDTLPVTVGGHDYLCAAMALNVMHPGEFLNMLGTYEILATAHEAGHTLPQIDLDLINDTHVVPGLQSYMFQMIGGGQLEWLRRLFTGGLADDAASLRYWNDLLARAAQLQESDMANLIFAPFLFGRFFPERCIYPHGALLGISENHEPEHIVRSMVDALAFVGLGAYRTLGQIIGGEPKEVTVTGGGTRNRLWLQRKADFLQKPLRVPQVPDATALGAAVLAGVGSGIYADVFEGVHALAYDVQMITPGPPVGEKYLEQFVRWDDISPNACAHTVTLSRRIADEIMAGYRARQDTG